ncbi:MAG: site-specific integrase [bacterium]|nr:site-specific integrase [bacterium]
MEKKRNAKGEGTFRENPNGTVTYKKSVGYQYNGQRKRITVTASSRAACVKEMRKKEEEWYRVCGFNTVVPGNTVADLCELHLRYQVEQGELKPKSIDRRECTIEKHIAPYPIGRLQLQAVKVSDVDSHISGLVREDRLSASSIEKVLDVLNAAYNWAVTRGELESNPVAPIKPTLDKRLQKMKQKTANEADVSVLSESEEKAFVGEALSRNPKGEYKYPAGLYGMLLLYTGMRCGEMLALRWSDVDFEHGLLTIEKSRSVAKNRTGADSDKRYVIVEGSTKNEKARKISLTKEAMDVLKLLRTMDDSAGEADLVVKTRTGRGNTATNLEHRMATIFHNAGLKELKGGLHIFRRTFATRMYERGARTKEIAAYIGDLESTTEKYYIAIRKKWIVDGTAQQIVELPRSYYSPSIQPE